MPSRSLRWIGEPGSRQPRTEVSGLWVVRLRWGMLAAQVLIILTANQWTAASLPTSTLWLLAGVLGLTNAVLAWRLARGRPVTLAWCGGALAFDTVQLTALLYVSGGASNPFSVFYLVLMMVAAVALNSAWTWLISILGVSCYGVLFMLPPAVEVAAGHEAHNFAAHLRAMWVALTLAAALTAFVVTRLRAMVAERDRTLAAMRESAARQARLASLTTLAAGTAHELGTPLATVAVAAGELDRAVGALPPDQAAPLADDVRLIREEIGRCRRILDGMAPEAGETAGEAPALFTLDDLARDVAGGLRDGESDRVAMTITGGATRVALPRRALARAVASLVRNAIDATLPAGRVRVELAAGDGLRVTVEDSGGGMPAAVLERAGEPFFTTKAPGAGLGLGLFLVQNLAATLGGRLSIESAAGAGTVATLLLPLSVDAHVQPG
jgi:two-component system sensor histidine kinase RegB